MDKKVKDALIKPNYMLLFSIYEIYGISSAVTVNRKKHFVFSSTKFQSEMENVILNANLKIKYLTESCLIRPRNPNASFINESNCWYYIIETKRSYPNSHGRVQELRKHALIAATDPDLLRRVIQGCLKMDIRKIKELDFSNGVLLTFDCCY